MSSEAEDFTDPKTTGSKETGKMLYEHIHAEEFAILKQAEAMAGSSSDDYRILCEAYSKLLNRSVRLMRMADKMEREILTTKKDLEISLKKVASLNDNLVRINNEKSEFLGIASHDLKNPITSILGIAGILREDISEMPQAEVEDFLRSIESSAHYMISLIDNLLNIQRFEDQSHNANVGICDFQKIVLSCFDDYRIRAARKNINVHFEEPPPTAYIRADCSTVYQIIDNLASNAVKYSPKGANIYFGLTSVEPSSWRFSIRDEGPGIPLKEQKKLYQKFARLTPQPTGGENSTGLGLAIVRRLVEIQNGATGFESEEGKGSTFWFEFPAARESEIDTLV